MQQKKLYQRKTKNFPFVSVGNNETTLRNGLKIYLLFQISLNKPLQMNNKQNWQNIVKTWMIGWSELGEGFPVKKQVFWFVTISRRMNGKKSTTILNIYIKAKFLISFYNINKK